MTDPDANPDTTDEALTPSRDELASPATNEPPTNELVDPDDVRPDVGKLLSRPLTERATVRVGAFAWALIGVLILVIAVGFAVARLSWVVVPLIIALFPAAVLQPPTDWLRTKGWPDWAAALTVLVGTLTLVGGIIAFIAPQFADQVDVLGDAIQDGYQQFEDFLANGPFGRQPIQLEDLIDQFSSQLQSAVPDGSTIATNVLGYAQAFFQTATATLLMLIALFFYLKDGRAIAGWVRTLFPRVARDDVAIIGERMWHTIGGYIQGQLLVALVDAIFIGIGLWILGVDLALPLAVLVFFGGLFPIVGATVSGFLAAIVALATNDVTTALIVVVLVLAVQNLEGQLLQPLILGRALELHPLAVIVALAVGGFLLGILGAFLAVPVAAASAQTIGYLRQRIPG